MHLDDIHRNMDFEGVVVRCALTCNITDFCANVHGLRTRGWVWSPFLYLDEIYAIICAEI